MKTRIKYLLVLVLAGFVLAGCCSMKQCGSCKAQQWEYKTYTGSPTDAAGLNSDGKDGWQLISVTLVNNGNSAVYYFKRPKQ